MQKRHSRFLFITIIFFKMKQLFIITFIFCVLIFGIQFFLYFKIRKTQSKSMTKLILLKFIPLFIVALGIVFHLLPHINIPIIGGVTIFDQYKIDLKIDETFGYKLFSIWATFGLMLSSMFFHLVFKVGIKSKIILFIDILIGLYSSILGILIIIQLNGLIGEFKQSFFGDFINISLAYGLYGIASIGFLYVIYVFIQNKLFINATKPSIDLDKLRELKKLFDEGILTKEEFEKQKDVFLN
jgi:hypothetical protein